MKLEDLGYNKDLEKFRIENGLASFGVARVIAEHKERYIVKTEKKELEAEIIGSLRFSANDRSAFPVVGDWVAISEYDQDKALIHAVFKRNTQIERKAVGKIGEIQIIAANIDYGLIIQAVDRDFNINRLERYLTICNSSGVKPIIVLNKIDLIDHDQLIQMKNSVCLRIDNVPVLAISNKTQVGYEELIKIIKNGYTYCLLGSSGVGKSTLLNMLSENSKMKTDSISFSTGKGRHVTSHRELVVLEKGGILIDNPGMREVGVADVGNGMETTFDVILKLSEMCKFKDCTHIQESDCAVLNALEKNEIDKSSYDNYLKIKREHVFFELSITEKRKKDREFGKMVKHFKKRKDQNKY